MLQIRMIRNLEITIISRETGNASKSLTTLSEYSLPNIQIVTIPGPSIPRTRAIWISRLKNDGQVALPANDAFALRTAEFPAISGCFETSIRNPIITAANTNKIMVIHSIFDFQALIASVKIAAENPLIFFL